MKKIIFLVVLVALFVSTNCWASTERMWSREDNAPSVQEFKVTYSVVYNSITLSKAAQIEKEIKRMFNDACKIDIKLEKTDEIIWDSVNDYGDEDFIWYF